MATSTGAEAPQYLTPADAARYLGISPRTLYALSHGRGLPAVRHGRLVRYRRADLDAWAAAHTVTLPATGRASAEGVAHA